MTDEDTISRADFIRMIELKRKPIFVKFTASWCGPCKRIKPTVDNFISTMGDDKFTYLEIDIDESMDLFGFMKSKKMVAGVPALLFYDMSALTYAPTGACCTGNIDAVKVFLNNVIKAL